MPSDVTAKIVIVQSIYSIHSAGTSHQVSHNIAQEIIVLIKDSKELSSKFGRANMELFDGKKRQAQNIYFLITWI